MGLSCSVTLSLVIFLHRREALLHENTLFVGPTSCQHRQHFCSFLEAFVLCAKRTSLSSSPFVARFLRLLYLFGVSSAWNVLSSCFIPLSSLDRLGRFVLFLFSCLEDSLNTRVLSSFCYEGLDWQRCSGPSKVERRRGQIVPGSESENGLIRKKQLSDIVSRCSLLLSCRAFTTTRLDECSSTQSLSDNILGLLQ